MLKQVEACTVTLPAQSELPVYAESSESDCLERSGSANCSCFAGRFVTLEKQFSFLIPVSKLTFSFLCSLQVVEFRDFSRNGFMFPIIRKYN